tara:strand:- start:6901 stop:7767 length:867 start_codon:yes stop_codon:yes gene_type:complete
MADFKKDYKAVDIRQKRRERVPRVTLTKVQPVDDDKRTRAELLDAIEDLFQDKIFSSRKQSYERDIDLDDLRSILTMLVLSVTNSEDDDEFPGFGTTSTTALRGNTTTITSDQATAITNNTSKVGITTSQSNAITANTSKRDARYIYHTIVANFNGNINTAQFVPLSDGETEGTNSLQRKNNFIAPASGEIHKVFVRSNASLQSSGTGVTLTGVLHKYRNGTDSSVVTSTATTTTLGTSVTNELDFSSSSERSFAAKDRLLLSLQAPLNAGKNYYVTVVFKLDQNSLD